MAKLLWDRGIPLRDAWLEFAPNELADELARTPGFTDAFSQKPIPENGMALAHNVHSAFANSQRRSKLELEIKEELLVDLFNGQLIATGFRQFPSISQSPVVIERGKFEADDPDWNRETLQAHGVKYGRIRITQPEDDQTSTNARQPKGSKAAIETAIGELQKSDPQFGRRLRQQDCQSVRKYLEAHSIPGNGLSDQNISKAIVRICGVKGILRDKI